MGFARVARRDGRRARPNSREIGAAAGRRGQGSSRGERAAEPAAESTGRRRAACGVGQARPAHSEKAATHATHESGERTAAFVEEETLSDQARPAGGAGLARTVSPATTVAIAIGCDVVARFSGRAILVWHPLRFRRAVIPVRRLDTDGRWSATLRRPSLPVVRDPRPASRS